jgi:hypothetical protein
MSAWFRFLECAIACKITAKLYKINTEDMELMYIRM